MQQSFRPAQKEMQAKESSTPASLKIYLVTGTNPLTGNAVHLASTKASEGLRTYSEWKNHDGKPGVRTFEVTPEAVRELPPMGTK